MSWLKRVLKWVVLPYFAYLLVAGVFIFLKDYDTGEEGLPALDTSEYYGDDEGPDRAGIIEDRGFALTTRVNLLEHAKESVKIANYSIYPGEVSDLFYGLILDTANRGVKIDLLFNGLAHNLHGLMNRTYSALVQHPNIELRFYEPLNLVKPWTLHNRMHDKIWLVDDTFALSGGRNIGDKYYLPDYAGANVYDRDVLIYHPEAEIEDSVLIDFNHYFHALWNHEYTKTEVPRDSSFSKDLAIEGEEKLLENLNGARKDEKYGLGQTIDWEALTYPTRKVSLVTNPLERMKKTPAVLETLNALMMEADESVIAQSPYLVINEELQEGLDVENLDVPLHILTNSQYSTPNVAAMSGMLKYREDLLDGSTQIYGYQGDGSIHGKSYIIDDRLSLVGSFNLDPRSTFLSTENLVVVDSEPFNQALTNQVQSLMATSRVYDKEAPILPETVEPEKDVPFWKKVVLNVSRILFYPFDELL